MKISEQFNLGVTQYELDFVDIDPTKDLPLFFDPYHLATRTDSWSLDASNTLRSFFQFVITLIKAGDIDKARDIFLHLGEPGETCLGLSRGNPEGKGVGPKEAKKVFDSLLKSRAVDTGLVKDLEDCRVFIHGIDKDKTSDMATNIIRGHLIEYTKTQCELWKIPLQSGVTTEFMWNRQQRKWVNGYDEMLIISGKKILLVPKSVVSFSKKHTPQNYRQHFVLNFLQNEHLRLNSVLVQSRMQRNGVERRWVTKKSVIEYEPQMDKEYLAAFTDAHPEVFREFKEKTARQLRSITNQELDAPDLGNIIDHLIDALTTTPAGGENASKYHRLSVGILELLFYPQISSPQVEKEVDEGRKRIDNPSCHLCDSIERNRQKEADDF